MLIVAVVAGASSRRIAQADDQFLGGFPRSRQRGEIRKQLHDKGYRFAQEPFAGEVYAVDPDEHFEADVAHLELGNDLLNATVSASGRFKVEGKLNEVAEDYRPVRRGIEDRERGGASRKRETSSTSNRRSRTWT